MFRGLFSKRRKTPDLLPGNSPSNRGIRDVRVGDEVAIRGLTEGYGDEYVHVERRDNFIIEQVNRYESVSSRWYELVGVADDKRFWIEWADEGELVITATRDRKPMGLASVGLTEEMLVRMDEDHSIDNSFDHDGGTYYYRNSQEAQYFQDNKGEGEGFYLWDFVCHEKRRTLSIVKWEGVPFQVFKSEMVLPENITVYKGAKP